MNGNVMPSDSSLTHQAVSDRPGPGDRVFHCERRPETALRFETPASRFETMTLRFETAALSCAILLLVMPAFSKSGAEILKVLLLFTWIFSGCWWKRRERLGRNPLCIVLLIFLGIQFLGVFWSVAPWGTAFRRWFSYNGLWLLPIVATLLSHRNQKYAAIACFNIGMIFFFLLANLWRILAPLGLGETGICAVSYERYSAYEANASLAVLWLLGCVLLPYPSRRAVGFACLYPRWFRKIINRAAHLRCTRLWHRRANKTDWEAKSFYLLRWMLVATIVYYLIYATRSRTAAVCLVMMAACFPIRTWGLRGVPVSILTPLVLVPCIYCSSPILRERADAVRREWFTLETLYEPGAELEQIAKKNSSGTRIRLFFDALRITAERPVLGFGTGGAEIAYERFADIRGVHDSHCEYTMVLVQWGFVGLALFVGLSTILLFQTGTIFPPWSDFGFYLTVLIATTCSLWSVFSFGQTEILYPLLLAFVFDMSFPKKRAGTW